MKSTLEYKGYHAKIEFDEDDMIFIGEVFGIQDSLSFHGTSVSEIVETFHQSIDNYLDFCAEVGKNPDREFKGSFNVRIDQSLHRKAAFAADRQGITLNQYVENAIKAAVNQTETIATYIVSPAIESASLRNFLIEETIGNKSRYKSTERVYS